MQIFFILFLVIIFMSFFGASILAYLFWWNRPGIIQSHEIIHDIEFIINDFDEGDIVTVRVYLNTETGNRKLGMNDSLSINGILMDAKYYNTGLAIGYKYTQVIKKAPKYILSLKREGKEEVIKVIVASSFTVKIPLKIYQNTDNIIPFISEIPLTGEKIYIGLSSFSDTPITNDNQGYPHSETSIYGKIVNNKILLASEDLMNLIPGNMKITIGHTIKQKDGNYVIESKGTIDLLKQ